jgi:hypothetical protein
MFANTLTITINAVAYVLTRVNQDNYGSTYIKKDATQSMTLQFRNNTESEAKTGVSFDRHNMFFEHIVYATPTTVEKKYTVSTVYRQSFGSDVTWLGQVVAGFQTLESAQKDGLIGWES